MSDSSVYIVSPPTLYLPTGGLSFCLVSSNKQWQENIVALLEKGIKNQLCFFANEDGVKDPKIWVWYWHVATNCTMIFVDLASCSEQEIRMSLAMCKEGLPVVYHVKPGNQEFIALLNAIEIPYWENDEGFTSLMESRNG